MHDTIYDVERDESPFSREDNTPDGDHEPTMPLGVELTGYRLLTTVVILGIGVPKAVYSYKGQALVSTTLDWLAGVILALIFFWLGVIEAKRPELSPRFFQADLAPCFLKFLGRPEVLLWLLSLTPMSLGMTYLRTMLDARRNHEHARNFPAHVVEDGLMLTVLAFSAAIYVFCLQCVSVIWPRVFRDTRRHALLLIINSVMCLVYIAYVVVKIVWHRKDYPPFIVRIAAHNVLWMYPIMVLPSFNQLFDTYEGSWYSFYLRSNDLMMTANIVLVEALLIEVWGLPNERFHIFLFSLCLVYFSLSRFLVSTPASRLLAHLLCQYMERIEGGLC